MCAAASASARGLPWGRLRTRMPHDDTIVQTITTRCGIVGGGPAGMMLGLLLARAGVDVVVLEKHADFLRDFRGDTIHPSTLEVMHELGILEEFLRRPHDKIPTLTLQIGDATLPVADFSHLPTHCKRSEEHTSELQSPYVISHAAFCLK